MTKNKTYNPWKWIYDVEDAVDRISMYLYLKGHGGIPSDEYDLFYKFIDHLKDMITAAEGNRLE